jgi:DNA-binding Xre family transcriptional regulator
MKKLQSNITVLAAQKGQSEKRRLSLRTVARESGVPYKTVLAIANNNLREYPLDVLERLCTYFGVTPGEIFVTIDID